MRVWVNVYPSTSESLPFRVPVSVYRSFTVSTLPLVKQYNVSGTKN